MTENNSVFTGSIDVGSWAGGGGAAHDVFDTSKGATFRVVGGTSYEFFDMILESLTEIFSEGESRSDTLSDAFVSFATGAMPIQVIISGYLLRNPSYDNRLDFLHAYDTLLRGSALEKAGSHLEFILKSGLVFKLSLQAMSFMEDVAYEDLTGITLQGVAYDYMSTVIPTIVPKPPEEDIIETPDVLIPDGVLA